MVAALALAGTSGTALGAAAPDPLVNLERTLLKRYPAVAGPLLATSPYRGRGLRVLYVSGAVSVWFQTRQDRSPACIAARANTSAIRDAILGQVMPEPDDVRFWASRGISPDRATDAFRAGIIRACKLRGG